MGPYDHRLTDKAYSSVITVTNISKSFYLQDGGKNQLRDKISEMQISKSKMPEFLILMPEVTNIIRYDMYKCAIPHAKCRRGAHLATLGR